MRILKWILLPFSLIYLLITSIRNFLYDTGYFKSYTFKTTTICVGNLSVGGTGKSPMIEHLIMLYQNDFEIAVLSRGYNRHTKGFLEVEINMTAGEVGDEPLQFKRKFKDIHVFVDGNRKNAIEKIEKRFPKVNLILLDDAYQHRRVKAHVNILLTTYANPFYNDFVLPSGRLRESRKGKRRAKVIVVTKCPDKPNKVEKDRIKNKIDADRHQTVVFSKISYDKNVYSQTEVMKLQNLNDFYLVTGIANPSPLINFLNDQNKRFEHLKFPDHHNFSQKEIANLNTLKKPILTTEKDFTRLFPDIIGDLYYIPIHVELDRDLQTLLNIKPQ